MYPPMGMPYPQAPYQPAYPRICRPGWGISRNIPIRKCRWDTGGMYPQMAPPMGMYPPADSRLRSRLLSQLPMPEPQSDESTIRFSMLDVRLPDPKTTGAKAAAPPPPPAPEPARTPRRPPANGTRGPSRKRKNRNHHSSSRPKVRPTS